MAIILTAKDSRENHPAIDAMFRARAAVFRDRLKWRVEITNGMEIDRYDREADPAYVITQDKLGGYSGSLRILPTTGETMINNEFKPIFGDLAEFVSPRSLECSRFCVHPTNDRLESCYTAIELLSALCEFSLQSGIRYIYGVYFASMNGVYRRNGWAPEPIAHASTEFGDLYVGRWLVEFSVLKILKNRLEQRSTHASHVNQCKSEILILKAQ